MQQRFNQTELAPPPARSPSPVSPYDDERRAMLAQLQREHQQLLDQALKDKDLLLSKCLSMMSQAPAPVPAPAPAVVARLSHPVPPVKTPAESTKRLHAMVVLSYQSKQEAFMFRLRAWLNCHGVDTVDGQCDLSAAVPCAVCASTLTTCGVSALEPTHTVYVPQRTCLNLSVLV